ncbi:MAG: heavy-metal-associated domain-containing protein [Thermoguttaceae bacterium]|jgi:copper chaperone CopZ/predicted peroxiredoxin
MSKTMSYLVVGVLAFLGGSLSVLLADYGGATNARSKAAAAPSRAFAVEGMMCQGCADAITDALTKIPGVKSAKVSLQDKRAVVVAAPADVPTDKILAAIAAAGYKGTLAAADEHPAAATAVKSPILVNITRGKDQLHAVAMAMALAQAAVKDGRPTTIFLNVEAPIFAAKDLDPELKCEGFPPFKKMLADFIAAGGRVLVCQHCAHLAKMKPAEMIGGAKAVAQSDLLAALSPGTVVLSY